MERLCEYLDCNFVRVICTDGETVEGKPICVDYADENEYGEDMLAIETPSRIVGIRESEIARIEVLKE